MSSSAKLAGTSVDALVQSPEAKQFAEDVASSLDESPRRLPSQYLYDALGSALFEAICQLPWYRVTRAETALLETHAAAILAACQPLTEIVELGPGSGDKLARLLSTRATDSGLLRIHLIDVSRAALSDAARRLGRIPELLVSRHHTTYESGLARLARDPAPAGRRLALLLGSNIGNFDETQSKALLRRVHDSLRPGDTFLLGADLIKPERELVLAYDDPLGVTAAFTRNVLLRVNRELEGDFELAAFDYRAVWNPDASRVEAHLVSNRRQTVRIATANLLLNLLPGEVIWTESAYKYTLESLFGLLKAAGFDRRDAWIDEEAKFALVLVQR